jgi:hypothetical protein
LLGGLPMITVRCVIVWMAPGLVIHFACGIRRSRLAKLDEG